MFASLVYLYGVDRALYITNRENYNEKVLCKAIHWLSKPQAESDEITHTKLSILEKNPDFFFVTHKYVDDIPDLRNMSENTKAMKDFSWDPWGELKRELDLLRSLGSHRDNNIYVDWLYDDGPGNFPYRFTLERCPTHHFDEFFHDYPIISFLLMSLSDNKFIVDLFKYPHASSLKINNTPRPHGGYEKDVFIA